MHFLFIASNLGETIGGVETLIARMSKWLLDNGHLITLLTTSATEFRDIFPGGTRIVELGPRLHQFRYYHIARREWPALGIERPDIVKSFHVRDAWISSVLSDFIHPRPKVLFGNYFPYVFQLSRIPYRDLENRPFLANLRRNFRDESILCIDREQIAQFRRQNGLQRQPVFWPLPIENPNKAGLPHNPQKGRIVSVSRLEPMKEYNLYMIDIVARLRKAGYPVTWTVYGEGSLAIPMMERIRELGLTDVITLKGRLRYQDYAAAMQEAYIYVGGGTAIVEAALCGVPGVMSLAFDMTGVTYGALYEYPFGNLGLRKKDPPRKTIEAEIKRLLDLGNSEYREEVRKNQAYARAYSMETQMRNFLAVSEKSERSRRGFSGFCLYYLAGGLCEISAALKSLVS